MPEIRIEVLDHGFVEYVNHMGDDNASLVAARISTSNPTGVDEKKDDALRERLWKDQHTSPFEMTELVVNLQLPVFCLRQVDRHRTLSEQDGSVIETVDDTIRQFMNRNEFSGRYSVMPDLFYVPPFDRIKGKDPLNKQGSSGLLPQMTRYETVGMLKEVNTIASMYYKKMIELGVASEIARFVLPGTQYTKIQLKGELLNWFKFLNLRLRSDVQEETRVFAEAIAVIVKTIWPKSYEMFEEYTLYAASFSRTERLALQEMNRIFWDSGVSAKEFQEGSGMSDKQWQTFMKKLGDLSV